MTDRFDEYNDVLARLVSETVACTPQEWSTGTLTIETDGTRIDYKLKNETAPGKAVISEKLRDLIDEFYVRMSQRGEAWTQAVITFDTEAGKFNTSFTYAEGRPKPSAVQAPLIKKPWWKFGA